VSLRLVATAGGCAAGFAAIALWVSGAAPALDEWLHAVALHHRAAGDLQLARVLTEGGSHNVVCPDGNA
jgi:hypothetical protein